MQTKPKNISFRSAIAQGKLIDTSDVQKFAQSMRHASPYFKEAIRYVSPEFGAYMKYSIWQEVGSKGRVPRPHIIPAVFENAQKITGSITDFLLDFVKANVGVKTTPTDKRKAYETAWLRVLNGEIRIDAVSRARALGVWQYGFHVRSIYGYAYVRSHSEMLALQRTVAAQQVGKSRKKEGG